MRIVQASSQEVSSCEGALKGEILSFIIVFIQRKVFDMHSDS